MQNIDATELLKTLRAEMDYHAIHPTETAGKFWYTLAGTITTIVAALAFKDSIPILRDVIRLNLEWFVASIVFVFSGYCFIVWGIAEHTRIHRLQRERLERAIDYLLDPANESFDYTAFWQKFGRDGTFPTGQRGDSPVKLITREPDTRKGWRFHDRRIDAGFAIILAGVLLLISVLVYTARAKPDAAAPPRVAISGPQRI